MLTNGDKHSIFPITNSHDGSVQLVKRILSALTTHSLDTILIGLEATSVYGYNLVYFLREDTTLAPFNRKIHVLNPKQVKKFKDAYNDLPKNDYVDAFVTADCLRFGKINKEDILETIVTKLSKTSHVHAISLFTTSSKRNNALYTIQEVFYFHAGEGIF